MKLQKYQKKRMSFISLLLVLPVQACSSLALFVQGIIKVLKEKKRERRPRVESSRAIMQREHEAVMQEILNAQPRPDEDWWLHQQEPTNQYPETEDEF